MHERCVPVGVRRWVCAPLDPLGSAMFSETGFKLDRDAGRLVLQDA